MRGPIFGIYGDGIASSCRELGAMTDRRKRSLLRGAKDEIELDKANKQKQGKVNAVVARGRLILTIAHRNVKLVILFYTRTLLHRGKIDVFKSYLFLFFFLYKIGISADFCDLSWSANQDFRKNSFSEGRENFKIKDGSHDREAY